MVVGPLAWKLNTLLKAWRVSPTGRIEDGMQNGDYHPRVELAPATHAVATGLQAVCVIASCCCHGLSDAYSFSLGLWFVVTAFFLSSGFIRAFWFSAPVVA